MTIPLFSWSPNEEQSKKDNSHYLVLLPTLPLFARGLYCRFLVLAMGL